MQASSQARHLPFDKEKLDSWCERGILGLILAILVFSPLATGSLRPQDFVVVTWLTTAVLALWLCRFWLNPKHRLLWPLVCWGVVAFMGYAVIRYLTADVEYVARQETIKVLIYGFLFLAILHNLHRLETIQLVGMVLLGLGTLLAMYALAQFLTGSNQVWGITRPEIYHKRGSGTFLNPNHLAGYLEILLPLALAYTLTGRLGYVRKVLVGYAALAIFAGIFVSISLGGWIATAGALVVLFIWLMRIRDYRLQALLLLAGMATLSTVFVLNAELSPNRRDRLGVVFKADDFRMKIWRPAFQMWQDNVWFGVGPAHFDCRFREYRPLDKNPDQMQMRPKWVHNDYLNTLVEWGLIGTVLIVLAWLLFYWDVFRSWKYVQRAQNDFAAKRSNKASFVMGGALGLLAILIHSVVDFNMHIPSNAILVVTVMALVSGHFRYATEKYWHTVHLPMRLVITTVLLLAIGYFGYQSWRRTQECYWLAQAEAANYASPEQLLALEKAFAAEDKNFETAYKIGEYYRKQSWQGGDNYQALAQKAMPWFEQSMKSNPHFGFNFMRYGMCLDWIGRHTEAGPYYEKAEKLDPHGYYTLAHIGWHYVQIEDWVKAKEWFEKSRRMLWIDNPIASSYLEIVNRRLAELQPQHQAMSPIPPP